MTHWESQKAHPKTLPGGGIRQIAEQTTPKAQPFVLVSAPSDVHAARQRYRVVAVVCVHVTRGHVNIYPT